MDTTFVIQGNLHKHSLENLDNYRKFGKVVISYWEENDESILTKYDLSDCILVKQNLEANSHTDAWNNINQYYQFLTTKHGLEQVTTPLAIKLRSDEKWFNLEPLCTCVRENADKLTSTNIYFKKFAWAKFHISDHIVASSTELMIKTFDNAIRMSFEKPWHNQWVPMYFIGQIPECLIGFSFMQAKGHDINGPHMHNVQLMKDNFRIVTRQELGYVGKDGTDQVSDIGANEFIDRIEDV